MKNSLKAASLTILAGLMAGCGASQPSFGGTPPSRPAAHARHSSPQPYVFVANCCGLLNHGNAVVYNPGLNGVARRIFGSSHDPLAVAIDQTGTLYLVNFFMSVTEYDSGKKHSSRIIDLFGSMTIALDGADNLYLDSCVSCFPSLRTRHKGPRDEILIFAPKQTKPVRTITQGVDEPLAMAVDAAGNLYVGNFGNSRRHPFLTFYAAGSTLASRKITRGIVWPGHMITDTYGDLFAAISENEVAEYAPGLDRRVRTINDGIAGVTALAVDSSGTLYVANTGDPSGRGWISVYSPGATSPDYQIVAGVDEPVALATDSAGNLYVADGTYGESRGHVALYGPNDRRPARIVKAGRYGQPLALAVGPQ